MDSTPAGKKKKKALWKHPWGYRESFLMGFFLLLAGFMVEIIGSGSVRMPAWPMNLFIIIIIVAYFFLVHYFFRNPFVKWLSSVPAAIASISFFTLMVMLMGFIQQGSAYASDTWYGQLGLTRITSGWPYLFTAVYLLVVLGFTIVRRIRVFTLNNIAFLLNHAGLWVIVVAASLGSADMWRLSMQLNKRHPETTAYDGNRQAYDVGIGMLLLDFSIEEYPPEIGLMRNEDFTLRLEKGGRLAIVEEGGHDALENFALHFTDYIGNARYYDGAYDSSDMDGGARAVYVYATDMFSGDTLSGWVSDGSHEVPPSILKLNQELSLAMVRMKPKKYSSSIRVFTSVEEYRDIYIEVNKPAAIDGWKIYQVGYDERLGRWSQTSTIEMVRDPWLPVVYTGIFMMLLGSLYLLWMGKGRTKTKSS
jgi:hypothetical protein